jgi:hypothetical protein
MTISRPDSSGHNPLSSDHIGPIARGFDKMGLTGVRRRALSSHAVRFYFWTEGTAPC